VESEKKKCPQCGSGDYMFRSRKTIVADPAKSEPEATETKYRCKSCGHEWRVRMAITAKPVHETQS
jgi:DNA-directed RNA polymerase subunit M/transcription elongation factor TFIIS